MVFDGHGTCLSVNPWGMQEMKSKGDMVGRHFLDIWHPDFKQEAEKHMTDALAGHQSTFEAVRHNGDDLAWWSVKLKPILESSYNYEPKFILFGSNISEEKQTKNCLKSLRNTEERYLELENILNSMLDPVHITNRDFEVEFVNRACTKIFGFHTPRIKCYKYFHDLESPCDWCRHEEVMTGDSYYTESYFEKTKKYFDAIHSPITKANGEIAKLVILRDITERKNAEEALRKSEARFQALFNTMAEGVAVHEIIYDEQGNASDYVIVKVNNAYEVLTGIAINDAVGKRASELYGTEKPPFFDIYIKVAETGESHDFVTYFEPMKKYFRISVFTPGKGQFATVFDDITDGKKNEEERERLFNELKGALAKIKKLNALLPICASCKKIRDDKGYWSQMETYISKHTDTLFSHGMCPDCAEKAIEQFEEFKKRSGH